MSITIKHHDAKFKKEFNPKVGLVALSTDQTIEGDFNNICKNLPLDIFINPSSFQRFISVSERSSYHRYFYD